MSFEPRNPGYEAVVRDSFARQAMMDTLEAQLTEVTPGAVTIISTLPQRATQQHGFAHAGLTFSIGDSAAGYAALSLLPPDHDVLTSEMKIHLLAPATGDRLVAQGRVLKPGKRLVIAEAEVWAETDTTRSLVAKLIGTLVPAPNPKDPT